jgi:RNA polymerase sigma-70 factor (ECF subfamily)
MAAHEPAPDHQEARMGDLPSEPRMQQLYEENLTAIYRFVFSKVGNREEAEDVTSQVFVKAVRHLDQARHVESIQSWLFQVARTTVADHWRQFYRLRINSLDDLLDAGWEGPGEDRSDLRSYQPESRVRRLLAQLPERYREVLTLRFLENCSIRETAEKMGLSEPNVKVLQFRALKKAAALERSDKTPDRHVERESDR